MYGSSHKRIHDSGPPAVRIDVPQRAMTQLPLFAPAANLSTPLSLGLRATPATNGVGRSAVAVAQARDLARQMKGVRHGLEIVRGLTVFLSDGKPPGGER